MTDKQHIIVVDPTSFRGGSKVATESILDLLDEQKFCITVLSADKKSWTKRNIKRIHLYEPNWVATKEQGVGYFIRHAFIAFNLLIARLRFGMFDIALGASGPGVDLSLYLLRPVLKFKVIQLVHGPVAKSRTIARCLKAANEVHYLQTTEKSLKIALSSLDPFQEILPEYFHLLQNGISGHKWPTTCHTNTPTIFWAASLLKWKGLDLLLEVLKNIPANERPKTRISFIKPQGIQLPVTNAPIVIEHVEWYENPNNIDQIRASCNIFVSTSNNEPFGLSILEAMAAGMCVVVPADGAYWDRILTDNINCIKFTPDQPDELKEKLLMLSKDISLITNLGKEAARISLQYKAIDQYKNIVTNIKNINEISPTKSYITENSL